MSESITIIIPSTIINPHIPLLIEKLSDLNTQVKDDYKDNQLKDIIAHLYVDCKNQIDSKKLLSCFNNAYQSFHNYLIKLENPDKSIVIDYLSQNVNSRAYASIREDDDFEKKINRFVN